MAISTLKNFVIAWCDTRGIYGKRYDSLGVAQGSAFKVSVSSDIDWCDIDTDSIGNILVCWEQNSAIFGQRYDIGGTAIDVNFRVPNDTNIQDQEIPAIAGYDENNYLFAWHDILNSTTKCNTGNFEG